MTTPVFEPPPTYAEPFIKEGERSRFNPIWAKWFLKIAQVITASGSGGGGAAAHNSLSGIQGGTTNQYYHLTSARYSDLTGAQNANYVLAGPTSGGSVVSAFRALVAADLPAGTGTVVSITAGTGLSGGTITTTGTIAIAGTITAGGPIGSATVTPIITYNAQGQLTTVSSATIAPAIGSVTGLGTGTATILGVSAGTSGSVGYLNIPQNSQSADYTTVLGDAGKHLYHPAADNNPRTFTIDSNAHVVYPLGTAITFVNLSASVVSIAITSDTMYLAGPGTTGTRALAQYGEATALKTGTTEWIISGSGLT